MRNIFISLLGGVALSVLASGCAGPEQKLGRGVSNTTSIITLSELNRGMEQSVVLGTPGPGIATGVIHGFNQTMARAGMGLYEIATFPFPPYHPVMTQCVPRTSL